LGGAVYHAALRKKRIEKPGSRSDDEQEPQETKIPGRPDGDTRKRGRGMEKKPKVLKTQVISLRSAARPDRGQLHKEPGGRRPVKKEGR